MDSPGHNAQYCTYTFMENSTKQILCVITMDKRMTDRKSTNLEKACFVKGLQFLLQNDIQVIEVITNEHLQISALMKKDYSQIKHSYDVWHGTKNLTKKLVAAGQGTDSYCLGFKTLSTIFGTLQRKLKHTRNLLEFGLAFFITLLTNISGCYPIQLLV